ncbi:MAG: hypothetical protein M3450_00375 [Actinomycetota bacterium]|nr:hypothetical protein [Actinomycetota bacterium]
MSDYDPDQSPEAEGIPETYDAPPGRDIETNEEAFMVPRDYPVAASEDSAYALTAAEERAPETVAERAGREEPDFGGASIEDEPPVAAQLMTPDSGIDSAGATAEEVSLLAEDDAVAVSAEEAAMHVTSEDVADDVDPAVQAEEYLEGR